MSNLNEYPLKQSTTHIGVDKEKFSHPSFGMIDIAKMGVSGFNFFGSNRGEKTFSITISYADVSLGLGTSWFHADHEVTRVYMNENQFSEILMTDSSVVPCTIRYSEKNGHIGALPSKKKEDALTVKVAGLKEFASTVLSYESQIESLLTKKGPFKKADKDSVIELSVKLERYINDNAERIKQLSLVAIDEVQDNTNGIIQEHLDAKVEAIINGSGIGDETKRLT